MISKKEFNDAINFIKKMTKKENKFQEVLELLSPETYCDAMIYAEYETQYIELLKIALGLSKKHQIIEWWIYDCEFGKTAILYDENDKEIKITSTDELYDYISALKGEEL